MKRTLAMVLASTLALTLLVSCTADVPKVSLPDTSSPVVSTPDVSVPDVSVPDVSTPDVSTPDVSTPDVSTPDVSIPEEIGTDMTAFYNSLNETFEIPMGVDIAQDEIVANYYAGLADIETVQSVVAISMMRISNAEYAFVEVVNVDDVDAVKAIFQARIDAQVAGGAWYPEPTRMWTEDSEIVTNGNFVMMIVDSVNTEAIIEAFNALFEETI